MISLNKIKPQLLHSLIQHRLFVIIEKLFKRTGVKSHEKLFQNIHVIGIMTSRKRSHDKILFLGDSMYLTDTNESKKKLTNLYNEVCKGPFGAGTTLLKIKINLLVYKAKSAC